MAALEEFTGYKEESITVLKATRIDRRIEVETGGAVFEWDLARGGQITRCDVKTLAGAKPLLSGGQLAGNLTLDLGDGAVSLAEKPVEAEFGRHDEHCYVFSTKSRLADSFTVQQQWEVFREGVVFCEFNLQLDSGKEVCLREGQMRFPLEVLGAGNLRLNYITRNPLLKQDVTCIHVLSDSEICLDRETSIDVDHLLAMFGLDIGWDQTRYFSNRLELVIEDSTSIGNGMMGPTRTVAGQSDGKWQLIWNLCENSTDTLSAPFMYRNKWGLLCGSSRTEAGPQAEPARRNNVLGARICHVMYPYVRPGDDWPQISVPVKQVFYQDAQYATENPPLERIDEAEALGANIVILHQFWMENGGSNGEPAADYKVHDPEWFKSFVDKAHDKGMRVGVYMRGVEHYSLYMDFFEKYLKRDWDGLYIDWATPFGLGFGKASSKHCSIHNWFVFSKALRKRVGENGFLIGHTNVQNYTAYAVFDAALSGEFSVMHSGLLAEPQTSTSYAMLGGCGAHIIAGNAPDRKLFSSQRCAGFSAGLGYSNHPFMEPGKVFKDCNAFIQPLWNLWLALGSQPVGVLNPAVGSGAGLGWSDEKLHPLIYQTADEKSLLIVSNLGQESASGSVELDFETLGIPAQATIEPLQVKGTHPVTVQGNRVVVQDMPPYFFAGLLIQASD